MASSLRFSRRAVFVLGVLIVAAALVPAQLTDEQRKRVRDGATRVFTAPVQEHDIQMPETDALFVEHDAAVRAVVWDVYKKLPVHATLRADYEAREVRNDEYVSPYTLKKVGKRPAGGWPLFIAMHGGGGVPKRINDSQWRIMQRYYKDQHSVEGYLYLALRAPTDKWNGFYTGYVFPIVDNLIRQFLLFGDVDPDRVHAMGYSHGGYGAFAIGPTMADRFGSVHSSAAAPTGGLTFAENLRNTRFTYMIGERDTAHGRQSRCLSFDQQITKLRGDMKDAFPVTLEFIKNHGHGGLPDRDKIKDMYPHVRKVSPTRLSWRPTYVKGHFWLRVPDAGGGQTIEAVRDGNKFKITTAEKTPVVDLMLDSRIVDFSREVTVVCNGKERVHEIKPALSTYCSTLIGRGDPMLAAPAWVRVVVE